MDDEGIYEYELQYHWKHLPTGEEGVRTETVYAWNLTAAYTELKRRMSDWNRLLEWKYWTDQ